MKRKPSTAHICALAQPQTVKCSQSEWNQNFLSSCYRLMHGQNEINSNQLTDEQPTDGYDTRDTIKNNERKNEWREIRSFESANEMI